jgi:hypothetical protein
VLTTHWRRESRARDRIRIPHRESAWITCCSQHRALMQPGVEIAETTVQLRQRRHRNVASPPSDRHVGRVVATREPSRRVAIRIAAPRSAAGRLTHAERQLATRPVEDAGQAKLLEHGDCVGRVVRLVNGGRSGADLERLCAGLMTGPWRRTGWILITADLIPPNRATRFANGATVGRASGDRALAW